jgi:hypothetical protein
MLPDTVVTDHGGKSTRSRASLFRPYVPTRLDAARIRGGEGQVAGTQRSGRKAEPTTHSPGERARGDVNPSSQLFDNNA